MDIKTQPASPAAKSGEKNTDFVKEMISKETDPAKKKALEDMVSRIREEERVKAEQALANRGKPGYVEPGPRYRVVEECYLNDVHYSKDVLGKEITYHGHPGHFLVPLNKEAKDKMQKLNLLDEDGNVKPFFVGLPPVAPEKS